MALKIQQGKILKVLSTADKGRAKALVDLMESKYGLRLIASGLLSHISSTTLFLAEDEESVNIWVLKKGHQCQFLQMNVLQEIRSYCLESLIPLRDDETDTCKTLYDLIIAPISHLINGEELTIVPNGSLFLIPYPALVDHHSRYLSEKLRIRLAPSLN